MLKKPINSVTRFTLIPNLKRTLSPNFKSLALKITKLKGEGGKINLLQHLISWKGMQRVIGSKEILINISRTHFTCFTFR